MKILARRPRLAFGLIALSLLPCLATGCNRSEGSDIFIHCERREAPRAKGDSLAAAVAQQSAANRAYRECMERKGFRWWS